MPLELHKAPHPGSYSAVEAPCTHRAQAPRPKTHASSPVPPVSARTLTGQSSLGISCLLTDVTAAHLPATAGPGPLLLWGTDLASVIWDSAPSQHPETPIMGGPSNLEPVVMGAGGGGGWGGSAALRTSRYSLPH